MKLVKRIAKGAVGTAGGLTGGLLMGVMGGAMNGVQLGIPVGFLFGFISLATGGGFQGLLASVLLTMFWFGVAGGILLGLFSSLLGLLLGLAFTWPVYVYGLDFSEMMGGDADVAGIPIDAIIYPKFHWSGTAVSCAIAWCMTILSTLWPAWYAARLEPVQAMRQH